MSYNKIAKNSLRSFIFKTAKDTSQYSEELVIAICNNVKYIIDAEKIRYRNNFYIGLFWPLNHEPNLISDEAIMQNSICIPKIDGHNIFFVEYNYGHPIEKSGLPNLYQPKKDDEVLPHLILVPGLAFSIEGYRIGFGVGHYDRYLAEAKQSKKILAVGVCFHEKLFEYLPTERHDYKLDYIITDKVIIKT